MLLRFFMSAETHERYLASTRTAYKGAFIFVVIFFAVSIEIVKMPHLIIFLCSSDFLLVRKVIFPHVWIRDIHYIIYGATFKSFYNILMDGRAAELGDEKWCAIGVSIIP